MTLSERGDVSAVARHPSFRLFAAMNPATDAGRLHCRNMPVGGSVAPINSVVGGCNSYEGDPPMAARTSVITQGCISILVEPQVTCCQVSARSTCGSNKFICVDAGKRELPAPLRNRFTEIYVAEPGARGDLAALVAAYLVGAAPAVPVDTVVDFYLAARAEAVRPRLQVLEGSLNPKNPKH